MVVITAAYTPHFESVARGVPAFADFTFLYLGMLIYIRLLMTAPVPKNSEHFPGIVLMIVASLIWPSMPVAIAQVISTVSPFVQIATRFTIGSVVFAPFARNPNRDLVRDGAILGLLMFAAFVTQTIALETIAANQVA